MKLPIFIDDLPQMFPNKFQFIWPRGVRGEDRLWWPCLLMDRDGMSNLYSGPSIDASYQVSDRLAKRFQRRRFLEIDQSEIRIACGGHVC
jgi:hypothetical protein